MDRLSVRLERLSHLAQACPGKTQIERRAGIAWIQSARLFQRLNRRRQLVLPIELKSIQELRVPRGWIRCDGPLQALPRHVVTVRRHGRSEEHTSELQSLRH